MHGKTIKDINEKDEDQLVANIFYSY